MHSGPSPHTNEVITMAKRQEIPDILGQERQKMTVMDDLLSGKPVVQVMIGSIRIDGGTQSRVELNQETVAEYAQAFTAGAEFPPVWSLTGGPSWSGLSTNSKWWWSTATTVSGFNRSSAVRSG